MNFYAYRMPGGGEVVTSKSEELSEGLGVDGFAVCAFDPQNRRLHTIPRGEEFDLDEMNALAFERMDADFASFPCDSTTRRQHADEVEGISSAIRRDYCGKGVAARAIVKEIRIDLAGTFRNLCARYPQAFVFCLHSDIGGSWIGATPETLVSKHGARLESMALAGTRPAGTPGSWDRKNIDEHNFVSLFVVNEFMQLGATPSLRQAGTLNAGPVEHLMSLVAYDIPEDITEPAAADLDVRLLALRLSPTPAVCGYPREVPLGLIKELETFDRSLYGGFVGPYTVKDNRAERADFFVNLRSMRVEPNRVCLYSGGGITAMSDPDREWEETEAKAATLLDCISTLDNNP